MTTIALVGGAKKTRGAVQYSQADEIWTPNWSYKYEWLPRIDRLFEMHPIWIYAGTDKVAWSKPKEHWEWLQEHHPYPIYMLRQHEAVPACVRYPIEDVIECIFGGKLIRRNWEEDTEEEARFFTSSFDYMFGLAILKQEEWDIDTIELFGLEMGSDTEYRYQKYGANFFIQAAMARGIKVIVPHDTVIVKSRLYGYEGSQMIFRTDLEAALIKYDKLRIEHTSALNHIEGQYAHLELALREAVAEHGIEHKDSLEAAEALKKMSDNIRDARDMASIAAGAFQAVKHLIDEVDLEVPDYELNNIWGKTKVMT
jgi:hypothetical protein